MSGAAFWVGAVVSAFLGLLLAEAADAGAWISPRLIRWAAKRLPTADSRDRYCEEWLAELHALDGLKLIKLGKATSLWLNSWRIRNVLRSEIGYVDLVGYSRELFGAVVKWWHYAWKAEPIVGAPGESGIRRNPEWIFAVIYAEIKFSPAGGLSDVEMTRCGTDETNTTIFAARVPLTVPARCLSSAVQAIAITIYDIWLIRKGYVSAVRLPAENRRLLRLKRRVEYRDGDRSRPASN